MSRALTAVPAIDGSSLPRQQQRRFQPTAWQVGQAKRSAVRLRDVAGDGQPQARAAAVAVAGGLEAVERLEHPFQLLRGNAGTAVEIGRASCRERVEGRGGGGGVKIRER